jgi:electron transfer flavoprotein beta subunit
MKIVVCIKQVLDTRVPLEIKGDIVQKEAAPVYIIAPAERVALQQAIDFKSCLDDVEVIVLTAGPERAEEALRLALAAGADEAAFINEKALLNADAPIVAKALATAVKNLKADLVLCGNRSWDMGAGGVPVYMAEYLGFQHVNGIIKLEASSAGVFKLWRKLERGKRQIVECNLPAVFAIYASAGQPRYASEFAIRAAVKKQIKVMTSADLGLDPKDFEPESSTVKLVNLAPPKPRPKKIFTPGAKVSVSQRMSFLLSSAAPAKKESNLLEGTPEYLAQQVVDYLTQEGILPKQR